MTGDGDETMKVDLSDEDIQRIHDWFLAADGESAAGTDSDRPGVVELLRKLELPLEGVSGDDLTEPYVPWVPPVMLCTVCKGNMREHPNDGRSPLSFFPCEGGTWQEQGA